MENSFNTYFDLLFRRLDHSQPEVARFKKEFEMNFQSLKKSCQLHSSVDILHCKKDFLEKFRQLLRYSCTEDAQSMYLNFLKDLDMFIDNFQNSKQDDHISTINNSVDTGATASFSSNKNALLFELSKENMKIQKELLLRKNKSQVLRNMTIAYKRDACLDQLNAYIKKEIFEQEPINGNIKSAMKIANDVQMVIDIMNQSLKDS